MKNLLNFLSSRSAIVLLLAGITTALGQEQKVDTIPVFENKVIINKPEETYPKFKLSGVFQARFLNNFKNNVDVDGLEHSTSEATSNTFDIKRMRVALNAKIMPDLEVVAMVNLTDFKSDTKTKVLENAFVRYTVNRYLQFTVGQFRPLFGMEDTYPVDIVESIDFSNSYYLFGENGWTSFQLGAAITGSVDLGKIPMSYGLSVVNGNGKNKIDDNNGKHYSSRLLFNLNKKYNLNIGASGGIAEVKNKKSYAAGVEATVKFPINDKWSFDLQTEARQGTNHISYFNTKEEDRLGKLSDYVMKSFYVLPNLRYNVGKKHFQAIEFSLRYEYLDANEKLNSNPRNTWTPMLSLEILKNYNARIQVGMQIDNYKYNIENTKIYNSNLGFVQFQCRF